MTTKGFKFIQKIQTRFSDFDMQRHLNNASYVSYFELARYKYFTDGIHWDFDKYTNVVASMRVEYKNPVLPQHELVVFVKTTSLGNKSFIMDYIMVSETNHELIFATAQTVQVCIDPETGKPIKIPEEVFQKITEFEDQ